MKKYNFHYLNIKKMINRYVTKELYRYKRMGLVLISSNQERTKNNYFINSDRLLTHNLSRIMDVYLFVGISKLF